MRVYRQFGEDQVTLTAPGVAFFGFTSLVHLLAAEIEHQTAQDSTVEPERPIATPGHTHHHLTYIVRDGSAPPAVFTGGSLLHGSVGRTDLIDDDVTDRLSRAQYRSVRSLAKMLPDDARIHPTHGFGSFCASTGSGDDSDGTLGTERRVNAALALADEDEFVAGLLDGLGAYPAYYAHMGLLNRAGAGPRIGIDRPAGAATGGPTNWAPDADRRSYPVLSFDDVGASEGQILDVRRSDEHASCHVAGAVNVPIHELTDRIHELNGMRHLVHCASGYRAAIAASLLDRAGRDVALIDDDFARAADAGLPMVGDHPRRSPATCASARAPTTVCGVMFAGDHTPPCPRQPCSPGFASTAAGHDHAMALSEREQEILRLIERDLGTVPSTSRLDGWLIAGRYVPRGTAWLAVVGGLIAMVALLPVSFLASFIVGFIPFALGATGIIVRPSSRARRRRLMHWIATGPPGPTP